MGSYFELARWIRDPNLNKGAIPDHLRPVYLEISPSLRRWYVQSEFGQSISPQLLDEHARLLRKYEFNKPSNLNGEKNMDKTFGKEETKETGAVISMVVDPAFIDQAVEHYMNTKLMRNNAKVQSVDYDNEAVEYTIYFNH